MSGGQSRVTTAVVIVGAALASASPAAADHIKLVTLAARYCPSYTSIRANEARNNIMESLHDLGANTPYGSADAMDPDVEAATQPDCQPLAGWHFTFGTGIQTRAVPGPWGALSKVTSPYSTAIVTLPSTPLLNNVNAPTGRTIAGAVTVELSDSQREQAAKANLWAMGGTPTAPIAEPDEYAFGALRCGVDNLNGDNVEYVSYPTGGTHVFCFAYYVRPAPTSGTIVVRKELQGVPAGTPPQSVRFTGNISYTTDQSFVLTAAPSAAGSATFYRASGSTWSFAEDPPPPGQEFAGVSCSSRTGTSTPATNQANRAASVLLAPGDTVTCTFTDRALPPSGLLLRKVTLGKVGTFGFSVTGGSLPSARHVDATTAEQGIAAGAPELPLATGNYDVSEQPPASPRGTWGLESVFCGGNEIAPVHPARVHVPASGDLICTFTNRFTPAGAIRVRKVTLGDVTTTSFVISPTFGTPARYLQTATTTAIGRSALADGDDTSTLPVGEYVIQETAPFVANPPGSWRVDAVECDGVPAPSDEGRITVLLTASNPEIDCTFTDEFTRPPELPPPGLSPAPPPAPDPLPGPPVSAAGATVASDPTPLANLVVTKTATPTRVVLGGRVRYLVTVRNRGPAAARSVTVAEQNARGDRFLTLNASTGHCHGAPPRFCVIGTLRAGARATVTVSVDPLVVGRLRNIVAVNTSTFDPTLRRNAAVAAIQVLPAPRPLFTG